MSITPITSLKRIFVYSRQTIALICSPLCFGKKTYVGTHIVGNVRKQEEEYSNTVNLFFIQFFESTASL